MYLSRLILNPRSRQVQAELARPYEMHRTILRAFPPVMPDNERVLFRVDHVSSDSLPLLLVQSYTPPDWAKVTEHTGMRYLAEIAGELNPAVKEWSFRARAGQRLAFRLLANPTRRVGNREDKLYGKRVGLLKIEDQITWLVRKGEQHGFRVIHANASTAGTARGTIPADEGRVIPAHIASWFGVRYDGELAVADPDVFESALANGIGSGKAFGFGLLSIAPPQ